MKTKLFSLSAVAVSSVFAAGTAFADVTLSAELLEDSATTPAGVKTYRVYANMADGWRVDAVYGNSQSGMLLESSSSFYQNALGGNTSKDINSAFFPLAPSVEWDSYVTIGSLYADGTPFGVNNLSDIGIDWSGFEAGNALSTENGSWFVTPDDAQGGEIDGRVLLAQLSVVGGSGDLAEDFVALTMNIQGKDAEGQTWNLIGGSALPIPAPGALALLGLAGVTARRRRK
ncbi:MAG: hypothetical protein MK073_01070 [Phycisphaerales bacterium]|nr:hypothetical protein [Phycisphaerales bacterium]